MAKTLEEYRAEYLTRDEAMARTYLSGAYSMRELGDFFGVHARDRRTSGATPGGRSRGLTVRMLELTRLDGN